MSSHSAANSTGLLGSQYSARNDALGVTQGLDVVQWPPPSVILASMTFHWPLTHVSMLLEEDCVSDTFQAAGFHWRLKFKAKGNDKTKPNDSAFASFHVENIESSNGENGPLAKFDLGVINQDFPEQCIWRPCQHAFNNKISDWGYARFMALNDLVDAKRGFVVNDTIILGIRF